MGHEDDGKEKISGEDLASIIQKLSAETLFEKGCRAPVRKRKRKGAKAQRRKDAKMSLFSFASLR